jgi:hypothetical protein
LTEHAGSQAVDFHRCGEMAESFLTAIAGSGFTFNLVQLGDGGSPSGYELRWSHQGFSFVGFKQPPPAVTPEEAKLLGCAALLQNDWCRKHLPKAH